MGAALSLAGVCTAQAAPKTHPNVVFIVVDDLGWGDVGYHGSEIATPNLDAFAKQGIQLDRFYVAPVSSPTRAGLVTGRYPSRFAIRKTVLPPWRKYGLPENEETVADLLGRNGYAHRAAIGKWHLGHGSKAHHPLRRGFTYFYGCYNGALDYFTHLREGELDWHRNFDACYDQGYTTDLIAREAVKCIKEYAQEGPYFVYTAFNAPHSPYQAPEEEIFKEISKEEFDKLNNKQKNAITYHAMVRLMDQGIGRILKAIEETGEAHNTLVLFMSDNGGVPGLAGGSSCLPLRGHKFDEWDGGVRVPAIIYWPKGFKNGRVVDRVTGFVDLVPTLKAIVGDKSTPKNPYDGIDLTALLKGKKVSSKPRDFYLGLGAMVNENYKLILPEFNNNNLKLKAPYLVDYAVDPYEAQNNAPRNPRELERLRERIKEYEAIVPFRPEMEYGAGREGFVAPKEWQLED